MHKSFLSILFIFAQLSIHTYVKRENNKNRHTSFFPVWD